MGRCTPSNSVETDSLLDCRLDKAIGVKHIAHINAQVGKYFTASIRTKGYEWRNCFEAESGSRCGKGERATPEKSPFSPLVTRIMHCLKRLSGIRNVVCFTKRSSDYDG